MKNTIYMTKLSMTITAKLNRVKSLLTGLGAIPMNMRPVCMSLNWELVDFWLKI